MNAEQVVAENALMARMVGTWAALPPAALPLVSKPSAAESSPPRRSLRKAD